MEAVKNEIILIYNATDYEDRKALGYAESLKDHKLKTIDVTKDKITETQLAELATKLNASIQDLLDRKSDEFKQKYEGEDFSDEEVLKLLANDLTLLNTPIAVVGKAARFVGSAYEFVNDDMSNKTVPDDEIKPRKREVDL